MLFVFACCAAIVAVGAEAPQPERRVLPVSVIDREGKFVEGLTAANFRGEFRGQPVWILSAELDTSPRRIALIVDTSKSMEITKEVWALVWAVAEEASRQLTPRHRVALLTLEQKNEPSGAREVLAVSIQQRTSFTSEHTELSLAISQAKATGARGGTPLHDGLVLIARAWENPDLGDAILLISDGVDTNSGSSIEEVATLFARQGVRVEVFRIYFPDPEAMVAINYRRGKHFAEDLTRATGGTSIKVDRTGYKLADLAALVRRLCVPIAHFYRLEIELPIPVEIRSEWDLDVVDAVGRKRKDLEIAYPRLLVPLTTSKR